MPRNERTASIERRASEQLHRSYSVVVPSLDEPADSDGWRDVGVALYIGRITKRPPPDYRVMWHEGRDEVELVRVVRSGHE